MTSLTFDEALEAILAIDRSVNPTFHSLGLALCRLVAVCPTDGVVSETDLSDGTATSIKCPECAALLPVDALTT